MEKSMITKQLLLRSTYPPETRTLKFLENTNNPDEDPIALRARQRLCRGP